MNRVLSNSLLEEILDKARPSINEADADGHIPTVADYIPKLGSANRDHLCVYAITTGAQHFKAGKHEELTQPFTMQSIAKTFSLILALQTVGEDEVFSRVGVEPTGDAFNCMTKMVESKNIVPFNPMINAGGISTASCCIKEGGNSDETYNKFLELVRKLCGRDTIDIDHEVYLSEKDTGTRNRAMAYLMEGANVLKSDAKETVDFYFKICSTSVTVKDLAKYAAVLANSGIDPVTGEVLVDKKIVKIVKSIMLTCGMYDQTGRFVFDVGMPAKSGVGGGIIACAENNMGIATFGPALNGKGNSAGGIQILKHLSEELGLHLFS